MNYDDERSKVTLHIQYGDGSRMPIQTCLDLTVEEFRLVVAERTGIPADQQYLVHKGRVLRNPQTLRSYEMEPDQIIHHAPPSPSTSIGSQSGKDTLAYPSETSAQDATCTTDNEPIFTEDAIKSLPFLRQLAEEPGAAQILENPATLTPILKYLLYVEIKRCTESSKPDTTENIDEPTQISCKLESMHDGHRGFSLGIKENDQLSLGFLDSSLVGSEPDSENKSLSNSSPNRDSLPNPQDARYYSGASSSQTEEACSTDESGELYRWREAHKEIINELVHVIFSDASLLRHFKEKGESIDRAIAAIHGCNDASQDQSPSEFCSLVKALDEYANPILNMFNAHVNDAEYDSSGSSSDGSADIAPEMAAEELIAPDEGP